MKAIRTTLGSLRCVVIDGDTPPELLVFLCHGYGAGGDDLVSLAPELMSRHEGLRERVRFVFPEAPLDLALEGAPGGRAWWALDMNRLVLLQQDPAAGISRLRKESPEALPKARKLLMGALDEALRQTKLSTGSAVLGGFSQGAMLATDVTLRLEEAPAALCIFSGTLIAEDQWRPRAAARRGLQVFQSHGRQDPLLPFANAEALRDLLTEGGLQVEFLPFNDGHTITEEALSRFGALLESTLGK
jgi:phospholipase/carboxylesterase